MNEQQGVIYILTNPSFPDYVKIGYADDIEKRLQQLNRSECIPFAFRVYVHSAAHSGRWCGGPAAAVRFKQRPKLVSYIRFNHHGVVLCCTL